MSGLSLQQHYLHLSPEAPLRFTPPVERQSMVFFDESNRQIFVVRDKEGITELTVVSAFKTVNPVRYRVKNKGPIVSIKFSLDQKILTVQRSSKDIDFINIFDNTEFTYTCKGKNAAHIIGFHWTYLNEIVLVTTQGVDLYRVEPAKLSMKAIKSVSVVVNWFVYSHDHRILLVSTSLQANVIYAFNFKSGALNRLPKFEIELPPSYHKINHKLLERDLCIAMIYGRLYCLHIRSSGTSDSAIAGGGGGGGGGGSAEIVLYQLTKETVLKRAVLDLQVDGKFAINVVDNVIVVHRQESRTSMLFDIRSSPRDAPNLLGTATLSHSSPSAMNTTSTHPSLLAGMNANAGNDVPVFDPLVAPLSIAPFKLRLDSLVIDTVFDTPAPQTTFSPTNPPPVLDCELYPLSWVVFQPNIIIDAKVGVLWTLALKLETVVNMISDKAKLVDFLLRRPNAKGVLLYVCRSILEEKGPNWLLTVSRVFDLMNSVYKSSAFGADGLPLGDTFAAPLPFMSVAAKSLSTTNSISAAAAVAAAATAANNGTATLNSTPMPSSPGSGSSSSLLGAASGTQSPPPHTDQAPVPPSGLVASLDSDAAFSDAALSGLVPDAKTSVQRSLVGKCVVVDQADMFSSVFHPLEENKEMKYSHFVAVLVEYIRSLNAFRIPVQHYLYELVINLLVRNNRFYQLHQFLQYHVVNDSKHVACLLLSLETTYPPAYQLALDMLKRLSNADSEIVDVLLSKGQLLSALRYIRSRSQSLEQSASAQQFLEAALATGDNMLFYTVYKFFEQRNLKFRKTPEFSREDRCEVHARRFKELFGSSAASS